MTGPGSGGEDYPAAVDYVLGKFEEALVERWHQTINDAVLNSAYIPPALHIYKLSRYTPAWDHRRPEVYAHALWGACPALAWYAAGGTGAVPSTSCPGRVRAPEETDKKSVFWPPGDPAGTMHEVPETIDCGIARLFAEGEEWAYQDRKWIFDVIPPFASQKLSVLQEARDTLVGMAADFGAVAGSEGAQDDPALQTSLTLADNVNALFVQRDDGTDWRADWTGTAADRASEGFFASTNPTLLNHALIANGLGALINERATIINRYRVNTIELITAATAALGEETENTDTTALSGMWMTVNRINTLVGWCPQATVATRVITVLAWLGEGLLGETNTASFSYTHDPGAVAINLYDEVTSMVGTLTTAEEGYTDDVAVFRAAVDEVPSTYLELYDLTENSPTGQH